MVVSRKHISSAKKTDCSSDYQANIVVGAATDLDSTKFFTVHLPLGAKKSMPLDPQEQLQNVLGKLCIQRGLQLDDYVPRDMKGEIIPLAILLFKIAGGEIIFTEKDGNQPAEVIIASPGEEGQYQSKSKIKHILSPRKPHNRVSKDEKAVSIAADVKGLPKHPKGVPNEYEFGEELGNGAFSVVLNGKHKTTNEIVAIKVLEKYEDDTRQ